MFRSVSPGGELSGKRSMANTATVAEFFVMASTRAFKPLSDFVSRWATAHQTSLPRSVKTEADLGAWLKTLDAQLLKNFVGALEKSEFSKTATTLMHLETPTRNESLQQGHTALASVATQRSPIAFNEGWTTDLQVRTQEATALAQTYAQDDEKKTSLEHALKGPKAQAHLKNATGLSQALLAIALDEETQRGHDGINTNRCLELAAAGVRAAVEGGEPFPVDELEQALKMASWLPDASVPYSAVPIRELIQLGLAANRTTALPASHRAQMLMVASSLKDKQLVGDVLAQMKPADGLLGQHLRGWDETPVVTSILHTLDPETIDLLAQKGFDLNEKDARGNTALHNLGGLVWLGGSLDKMNADAAAQEALLRNGASAHIANDDGLTAAQVAGSLTAHMEHIDKDLRDVVRDRMNALIQAPASPTQGSATAPPFWQPGKLALEKVEAFIQGTQSQGDTVLSGGLRSGRVLKMLAETKSPETGALLLIADSAKHASSPTDLTHTYCKDVVLAALQSGVPIDYAADDGFGVVAASYLQFDKELALKTLNSMSSWLNARPSARLPAGVVAMALGMLDRLCAWGAVTKETFDTWAPVFIDRADSKNLDVPAMDRGGNYSLTEPDCSVYAQASLALTQLLLSRGVPVSKEMGRKSLLAWLPTTAAKTDDARNQEYFEKFKLLTAHGVDPLYIDSKGYNAILAFASSDWLQDIVRFLIKNGVPPDGKGYSLHHMKDAQTLELALASGFKFTPEKGAELLMDWAFNDIEESEVANAERGIRALLAAGADPFLANKSAYLKAKDATRLPLPIGASSYEQDDRRGPELFLRIVDAWVKEGKLSAPSNTTPTAA